jgi:hypothetical protein
LPGGPWVFVSVQYRAGTVPRADASLWWLRLSPGGDAVERVGCVTPPFLDGTEVRTPVLAEPAAGVFALAFLSHRPDERGWSVRIVPVTLDPATDEPAANWGEVRTLASGVALNALAFSQDGRSVFAAVVPEGGLPRALRLDNPFPEPTGGTTP